jgi:hypothetical protein
MSTINGISTAGPQALPAPVAPQPSSAPASQAQDGAVSGYAAQPAVIVSLSSEAAASAKPVSTPPSLDPNQVDDALSWTAGANGFAANYARADWSKALAKFGQAIVDRDKATVLGEAINAGSHALSFASDLGIPVQASVSSEAIKNGAAPGTISVGTFSFTNGGSTYAVTPGKDNTLVGTKNGQAWKTWQLTDSSSAARGDAGATAALQALTSLNAKDAWADKAHAGFNVSA